MTKTSTAVQHFIAVAADEASRTTIDGIGHTAEEAIAEAVKVTGAEAADFVAQRCTSDLYRQVELSGGDISWEEVDGVQDIELDEGIADLIAEFVSDGVEKNWLYNNGHPSSWNAQDAIQVYVHDDGECDPEHKTYAWSHWLNTHQRLETAVVERVQKFMDEYPAAEAAE